MTTSEQQPGNNLELVLSRAKAYYAAFDGNVHTVEQAMPLIDALYDSSFRVVAPDGETTLVDRNAFVESVLMFFQQGRLAKHVQLKGFRSDDDDDGTEKVEYSFEFSKPGSLDPPLKLHAIATCKNGKYVQTQIADEGEIVKSYKILYGAAAGTGPALQVAQKYFAIYNGSSQSFEDHRAMLEEAFAESFYMETEKGLMDRQHFFERVSNLLAQAALVENIQIDAHPLGCMYSFEMIVKGEKIRGGPMLATFQNGKFVKVQELDEGGVKDQRYYKLWYNQDTVGTKHDREIMDKAKKYFAIYDGKVKTLESVMPILQDCFDPSYHIVTPKGNIDRRHFLDSVNDFLSQGARVHLRRFQVYPHGCEYECEFVIHGVTTNVHSIAVFENGKFMRSEPIDEETKNKSYEKLYGQIPPAKES